MAFRTLAWSVAAGIESTPWALIGGYLWLDLINTQATVQGEVQDLLGNVAVYRRWLAQALALRNDSVHVTSARLQLERNTDGDFPVIHQFRQALRDFAEDALRGKQLSDRLRKEVNQILRTSPSYLQLTKRGQQFETELIGNPSSEPLALLLPVAQSLVEFVTTADVRRLHRCGNPECILFFYDETKNGGRRFCSPATCGNRVRVAAYYRRHRAKPD